MPALDGIDSLILAGGLGTRLSTVLPGTQKVMASVAGRPFLDRILGVVERAGGRRVVLLLGHRAGEVTDWVAKRPASELEIVASVEGYPLGTGGAIRHALPHIRSDTVLVLNGDSFAPIDLGRLVEFHRRSSALVSMVLARVEDRSRYGSVATSSDGAVSRFIEKGAGEAGAGLVNGGIYLMDRRVIARIPRGVCSLEHDVFPRLCGRGLYAIALADALLDIGTPESLRRAAEFFAPTRCNDRT